MTKAEEALYHILCARWKLREAELTQAEIERLLDRLSDLSVVISNKRKLAEVDTTGMVVQ